jgi:prepilin signal peptidase PulO-like enzyme (type II secretory pathway)
MIYMTYAFYMISFIFTCLTIASFLSLNKARMYPPKQILRKKIGLYVSGAIVCFLIGWSFQYLS